MQLPSVTKLFDEIIDRYTGNESTASSSPIVGLFFQWIKRHTVHKKLDVCEFGGAAGQLLKEIETVYPNSRLTNVEIVENYRKHTVSPSIRFVQSSLLDSKLPSHSFDVLIIRDVLHHLVGKNYKETLMNQKRSLSELKRLLRPGGVLFIEEITIRSSAMSLLLYALSKINSFVGINLSFFQISPHSVILFFTPERLTLLCRQIFSSKNIHDSAFLEHSETWQYRLVHLGTRIGKMLITIESPRK